MSFFSHQCEQSLNDALIVFADIDRNVECTAYVSNCCLAIVEYFIAFIPSFDGTLIRVDLSPANVLVIICFAQMFLPLLSSPNAVIFIAFLLLFNGAG
jgi:hypothetical protein